ncbi:hypothetical protein SAMN05216188_12172 [Lentzea xinjiangensis]|uniref:Uncharacterized protein n=1 Tax=Lentzea xinjiangensis TaxID=402600 RepID=A0A1H9UF05_9PSEU|nr:hypothetical protein [Lentzea xinjiangensis]SES07942.1 hypothetical protein SAMN05216188_12172 [Lentzea xinjiangensis]
MTALAVERMSVDAVARDRGADSISDATVGRKIADKEDPVDARSVRTIVLTCGLAAQRRGESSADADVRSWLRARTRLVESAQRPDTDREPAEPAQRAEDEPAEPPARRAWLAAALVAVLLGAAGADVRRGAPADPVPITATDDLTSGGPPCPNPPDRTAGDGITMTAPAPGTLLTGDGVEARGTVELRPGERPPWLLLYAPGVCKFYVQQPVTVSGTTWSGTLYFDPVQPGRFVGYVVVVDAATDRWLAELTSSGKSPYIVRLPPGARAVHVTVRCCG